VGAEPGSGGSDPQTPRARGGTPPLKLPCVRVSSLESEWVLLHSKDGFDAEFIKLLLTIAILEFMRILILPSAISAPLRLKSHQDRISQMI
jgi:hypothetical protein